MTNEHNREKNKTLEGHSNQPTIRELAQRHLNDKDHTTSDEEMKNARLEEPPVVNDDSENLYELDHTTVIPPFGFEKDKDNPEEQEPEEKNDDETDRSFTPPNPYDVLR